ncbi:MAG: hypothetical protein AAGU14_11180, partial [Eubacteriaceae bacterium]
ISVDLANASEPSNKVNFTSETIYNATTKDASQTVSIGSGSESTQSGGVYFTGNKMLIKRGGSNKKMIQYVLTDEIAKSLSSDMPANRLDKLITNNIQSTGNETWTADIDAFIAKLTENTTKQDYKEVKETKSVLGKEQELSDIVLNINGEKAQLITAEFLKLLQKQSNIKSVISGTSTDNAGKSALDKALLSINSLTADEAQNLQLVFKTQMLNDKVFGFELTATINEKSFVIASNHIVNGFEQQQELKLTNFDKSGIAFASKDVSQGGDNYKGDMSYINYIEGGSAKDSLTAQWSSVKTDKSVSSDYSYKTVIYYSEDGKETAYNANGSIKWTQSEASDGSIDATGSGNVTLSLGGDAQKLLINMKMNKKFGDTEIKAPQFIESSGISVNSSDALVTALDIDKNEYLKQNAAMRAIGVVLLLLI